MFGKDRLKMLQHKDCIAVITYRKYSKYAFVLYYKYNPFKWDGFESIAPPKELSFMALKWFEENQKVFD